MINQVLEHSRAMLCVDCGKCVAVCPMAGIYKDFSVDMSPRGIIQKALLAGAVPGNILEDAGLWCCLGCNAGTEVCPEGVSCRDLIMGLKSEAIKANPDQDIQACTRCGASVTTLPIAGYIRNQLAGKKLDYLRFCPTCRQQVYMERNTME